MPDEFADFPADPSGEKFLRLRDLVVAAPDYDFYSTGLDELADLVEEGIHDAVPDKLSELMPGWLLSPRAHLLAEHAARQTGNAEAADRERYVARACLNGLFASGDGTRAQPYRVTHVADEYDLLDALGKEAKSQRQIAGDDGVFDRIACGDGSEVWFDISLGLKPAL